MNPRLQGIYEETQENKPRSRLDPYGELILRWRRRGKTYRLIQMLLADKCSLQVSTTMIFKFVKSRSRPRKQPEAELAAEMQVATQDNDFSQAAQPARRNHSAMTGRPGLAVRNPSTQNPTLFDTSIEGRTTVRRENEEEIKVWKP